MLIAFRHPCSLHDETAWIMNNGSRVETEHAKKKIASKFERNGIAKDKYKWDESAVQRG